MYVLKNVNGYNNLRTTEIICDTIADLDTIPIEKLEMGSTVKVIKDQVVYILDSNKDWVEYSGE